VVITTALPHLDLRPVPVAGAAQTCRYSAHARPPPQELALPSLSGRRPNAETDLEHCPACESDFAYPVEWEPIDKETGGCSCVAASATAGVRSPCPTPSPSASNLELDRRADVMHRALNKIDREQMIASANTLIARASPQPDRRGGLRSLGSAAWPTSRAGSSAREGRTGRPGLSTTSRASRRRRPARTGSACNHAHDPAGGAAKPHLHEDHETSDIT
jgi:hypothetical protein